MQHLKVPWLPAAVSDSEILPKDYRAYQNNRVDCYGGALLAIKTGLIHHQIDIDSPCNIVAAKVELIQNQSPLVVVTTYRPTNIDTEYIGNLCAAINKIAKDNPRSAIWVGGDLNLPVIEWDMESRTGNHYPVAISDSFLNTTRDHGLKQTVNFPTQEENTLDLFLTNRPPLVSRCKPVPGLSDHEMTYTKFRMLARCQQLVQCEIHPWARADFDKVREEAANIITEFLDTCDYSPI